jgi:Domain of unknown function (DUF6487)
VERSDDHVCIRCGEPAEQGYISWNGYALYWGPTRRKWLGLFTRTKEPLLRHFGLTAGAAPARRCPACRTLWLSY